MIEKIKVEKELRMEAVADALKELTETLTELVKDEERFIKEYGEEIYKKALKQLTVLKNNYRWDFEILHRKYKSSLFALNLAVLGRANANKQRKIDPYIAGGAAQGIAGLGAGLYAASNASNRNNEIDEWRRNSEEEVIDREYEKNTLEKQRDKMAQEIMSIIESYSELKEVYLKYYNKKVREYNERVKKNEEEELKRQEEKEKENMSATIAGVFAIIAALITLAITDERIGLTLGVFVFVLYIVMNITNNKEKKSFVTILIESLMIGIFVIPIGYLFSIC